MPLDSEPVERVAPFGVGLFVIELVDGVETAVADTQWTDGELPRYKSHFATCEFAASHRQQRGSTLST